MHQIYSGDQASPDLEREDEHEPMKYNQLLSGRSRNKAWFANIQTRMEDPCFTNDFCLIILPQFYRSTLLGRNRSASGGILSDLDQEFYVVTSNSFEEARAQLNSGIGGSAGGASCFLLAWMTERGLMVRTR